MCSKSVFVNTVVLEGEVEMYYVRKRFSHSTPVKLAVGLVVHLKSMH